MKDTNEIRIKYKTGVETKGDVKNYTFDYISATKKHTKRFNSAIMTLMGITGCERDLMDWIADNMTEGNYISNNPITRQAFIDFHKKYKKEKGKEYSMDTVRIAFQGLSASGMLIPQTRGLFIVNPFQYFKGDEESRIKLIRMIMDFKPDQDTKITVEVNK